MPGAEVEGVEFGQGTCAHPARTVAGAIQAAVVYADPVPVSGEPDVAFDAVNTLFNGMEVRAERVFSNFGGGTAMSEDERAVRQVR